MFIREDFQPRELRPAAADSAHFADPSEFIVWSPVSNRFTSWTFRPLCRCDEQGRIIKGSRIRCPFVAPARL